MVAWCDGAMLRKMRDWRKWDFVALCWRGSGKRMRSVVALPRREKVTTVDWRNAKCGWNKVSRGRECVHANWNESTIRKIRNGGWNLRNHIVLGARRTRWLCFTFRGSHKSLSVQYEIEFWYLLRAEAFSWKCCFSYATSIVHVLSLTEDLAIDSGV